MIYSLAIRGLKADAFAQSAPNQSKSFLAFSVLLHDHYFHKVLNRVDFSVESGWKIGHILFLNAILVQVGARIFDSCLIALS